MSLLEPQRARGPGAPPGKTSRVRAGKISGERRGGWRSTTRRGNGVGAGPASGDGWGGPPKGAGSRKPRKDLAGTPGPGRGKFSIAGEARREQAHRRTDAILELLWEIATNEKAPTPARIAAAVHLLNRLEGLPAQMVLTATHDDLSMMTDDELAAEVRAFRTTVLRADKKVEPDAPAVRN